MIVKEPYARARVDVDLAMDSSNRFVAVDQEFAVVAGVAPAFP